jgi:hypothetical protein
MVQQHTGANAHHTSAVHRSSPACKVTMQSATAVQPAPRVSTLLAGCAVVTWQQLVRSERSCGRRKQRLSNLSHCQVTTLKGPAHQGKSTRHTHDLFAIDHLRSSKLFVTLRLVCCASWHTAKYSACTTTPGHPRVSLRNKLRPGAWEAWSAGSHAAVGQSDRCSTCQRDPTGAADPQRSDSMCKPPTPRSCSCSADSPFKLLSGACNRFQRCLKVMRRLVNVRAHSTEAGIVGSAADVCDRACGQSMPAAVLSHYLVFICEQ